jgi:negative regulator of flagellin synthesis FlgM
VSVEEANMRTTAEWIMLALSGSDIRTDKIAALQQAIAAGTYRVSSSDLADKMIASLLQ